MSIVNLNGFIELSNNTGNNITSTVIVDTNKLNTLFYLNLFGIICFVMFYILYSLDKHLRKPPSKYLFLFYTINR